MTKQFSELFIQYSIGYKNYATDLVEMSAKLVLKEKVRRKGLLAYTCSLTIRENKQS